jgi:hypothetical protein
MISDRWYSLELSWEKNTKLVQQQKHVYEFRSFFGVFAGCSLAWALFAIVTNCDEHVLVAPFLVCSAVVVIAVFFPTSTQMTIGQDLILFLKEPLSPEP